MSDHNCCPCMCASHKDTGEIVHLPPKSQNESEDITLRDKTIQKHYAKIRDASTRCSIHNDPGINIDEMEAKIEAFEHKKVTRN